MLIKGVIVMSVSLSNAHHHPPEEALGRANTIAPGRVDDDVRHGSNCQSSAAGQAPYISIARESVGGSRYGDVTLGKYLRK